MQPIEATDYHDIVQVEDPQLSPDGERVAFVRKVPADEESYDTTVYVVPTDGSADPRRFSAEEGTDASPRWSPSGDRLAFTSVRGEAETPQLFVMPTDGGEAAPVTNVVGGVGEFVWSPDGERIAFTQSVRNAERENDTDLDADNDEEYERDTPDPRVVDRTVYRTGTAFFDGARPGLYTVDPETKTVTRRTDDGEHDFGAPEFGGPDELYYTVKRAEDPDDSVVIDIECLDLETGETTSVTRTTGWMSSLSATEDGRIAYPRTPEDGLTMRQTDLEVYDRTSEETVSVTGEYDRTVGAFDWAGDQLAFVSPDEGDYVLNRAPVEDGATVETLVGEGHLTGFSAEAGRFAFVRSAWDHRGDVFSLVDGERNRLTEVNADYLEERQVLEPEELRFESDGEEIQGWLLTPPEATPEDPAPLVVEIHGGPHAMWSTSGTMWHEFQLLAARGYAVFWSNPRGSTGYGEDFCMAIERDWGEVTLDDVLAGADLACERPAIDGTEQFVTGGSFGGYMTAWAVGHTDRFAGAVSQRGVYGLTDLYGTTDGAYRLIEDDFRSLPWEDPEFLWEHSPAAHADAVSTPTLLIHAENDYRVPIDTAEQLFRFYRKCDVETRLVRYPRDGHELSRSGEPGHVVDRLERIVRWFDGYSEHVDVPRALDRGEDGLSAGAEESDEDADEDE